MIKNEMIMRKIWGVLLSFQLFLFQPCIVDLCAQDIESRSMKMEIGPFCSSAPYGITILMNRGVAFVVDPEIDMKGSRCYHKDEALLPYPTSAPDGSYTTAEMSYEGHKFTMTYGRLSDHAVGMILHSQDSVVISLRWRQPFSGCKTVYWTENGEFRGSGIAAHTGEVVPLRVYSHPALSGLTEGYKSETTTLCSILPSRPTVLVISVGNGTAPSLEEVTPALKAAAEKYENTRVISEGDWGNFAGAIAKSMNASRMFSSLDRRIAHSIGRGWWISHQTPIDGDDDQFPYFAWDSFFNANMAALEDPQTARETVRAILSMQNSEGMVPNYAHWPCGYQFVTPHRTNPPVGALCVWKLHQRFPDIAFLNEVYPKLVKWHDWFRMNRARKDSYLLSWGNGSGSYVDAVLETGWDDTPAFEGGKMEGHLLNQYHVDLSSLWAMDAEYLTKMAETLGRKDDVKRFGNEYDQMVKEINDKLWNDSLGVYCHRFWEDNPDGTPHFVKRLTPMNFYPLICGAPSKKRAQRMFSSLHAPSKFWSEYLLPTLSHDDPDSHQQHYWRGQIWGPVNYLLWQGLLRYDDKEHLRQYVQRSVRLFMKNWNTPEEICGENYRSDTGNLGDDPHYTWGALLPLIGVEALVDINSDLTPVARNLGFTENLILRRIPIGGKLYRIENHNGKVSFIVE